MGTFQNLLEKVWGGWWWWVVGRWVGGVNQLQCSSCLRPSQGFFLCSLALCLDRAEQYNIPKFSVSLEILYKMYLSWDSGKVILINIFICFKYIDVIGKYLFVPIYCGILPLYFIFYFKFHMIALQPQSTLTLN